MREREIERWGNFGISCGGGKTDAIQLTCSVFVISFESHFETKKNVGKSHVFTGGNDYAKSSHLWK